MSNTTGLEELNAISNVSDANSRIFFICANNAWDWAIRRPDSWYAFDKDSQPVWAGPTEQQQKFYEHLLVVVNDFDVVSSIVYRLEWLRTKYSQDNSFLSPDDLATFLQCDLHAFHTELRSLLDSLCHAINVASAKPGQVPTSSFNELRGWCISSNKRSYDLLGEELTTVISQAGWFEEIRDLRDDIIHHQSDALVRFIEPSGEIGFLTFKKQQSRRQYAGPQAFVYKDWVFFRPHAGYYVGRLINLLNQCCAMAANRLGIHLVDMHWGTDRMPATKECVELAIQALEKGSPV